MSQTTTTPMTTPEVIKWKPAEQKYDTSWTFQTEYDRLETSNYYFAEIDRKTAEFEVAFADNEEGFENLGSGRDSRKQIDELVRAHLISRGFTFTPSEVAK